MYKQWTYNSSISKTGLVLLWKERAKSNDLQLKQQGSGCSNRDEHADFTWIEVQYALVFSGDW